MKPKKIITAGVLLALAGALWYLGKSELSLPLGRSENVAPQGAAGGQEAEAPSTLSLDSKPMKAAEAPVKNEGIPAWELKIDDALRSNADPAAIAQVLLQQVLSMPGEGQLSSARHIVNLMPDKDYLSVLPYVRNVKLDPGFQEVVVAESLNRPDVVKLPLLLAAAQTPNHPMAEIAKSTLAFLLDANFENDWGKWDTAVKEALAKQAAQ
jgi:hypothetical protein